MNTRTMLETVSEYYFKSPGVGHTYKMINGIGIGDPFAYRIVTVSEAHCKDMERKLGKRIKNLSLNASSDKWRGLRVPLMWDNFSISHLVLSSLELIRKLEHELAISEKEKSFLGPRIQVLAAENIRLETKVQYQSEIITEQQDIIRRMEFVWWRRFLRFFNISGEINNELL